MSYYDYDEELYEERKLEQEREWKLMQSNEYAKKGQTLRCHLWKSLSHFSLLTSQNIKGLFKQIRAEISKEYKRAKIFAQYIEEKDLRDRYIQFVEEQEMLPIEMYIDDETDPFLAIKQYLTLYLKRKTDETPQIIAKKYLDRVLAKCKTRGHSMGKGFLFTFSFPKGEFGGYKDSDPYSTFDKELIYEMEPKALEYLSLFICDIQIMMELQTGGWSCG